MFASTFLLPTLGVSLMVATGVGFVGFCLYMAYVVLNRVFGDPLDAQTAAAAAKSRHGIEDSKGRTETMGHGFQQEADQVKISSRSIIAGRSPTHKQ